MRKNQFILSILLCLMLQGMQLSGTELMPWTETDFIFYPRFEYFFQHYDKVKSSSGSEHRKAYDHFYTLGVSGCYDVWNAEVELTTADTRHRSFGVDNFRITGRYLLMNDIIDDPLSIMLGGTYIYATNTAVHDISSFHHGQNEGKIHIAFGKEKTCYDTWSSRWWSMGAFGIADRGSPWLEAMANWEKQFCRTLYFRVYASGLLGLGDRSLDLDHSFHGYGSIKHRSIDVGIRLTRITENLGIWYVDYAKRVYAHNFPASADLLKFNIIYPIPL